MKIALIISALLLLQAAPPVPRQAPDNGGNNAQQKQSNPPSSNQAAKNTPSTEDKKPPAPTEPSQPDPCTSTHKQEPIEVRVSPVTVTKDWKDNFYIGLSAALVIVGGLTLWTIRYQAVQTKTAAEAAKLNAEALISSQRAWVVASPAELRPPLGSIPEQGDPLNAPGRDSQNIFYMLFKNLGVTPAKVLKVCLVYRMIPDFSALPPEPIYPEVPLRTGVYLYNRKDAEGRDEAIGQLAFLTPNPVLTKAQVADIVNRKLRLYAYGYVWYEDIFLRKHTMRFGYAYNFPQGGEIDLTGFMTDGPEKYNQAD